MNRDPAAAPIGLGREFFAADGMRAAFSSHHMGKVFKAFRCHPRWLRALGKSINQETLGRWVGLSQAQVSKAENGRPEQNIDVLCRQAEALGLPKELLWFDFPGESRVNGSHQTAGVEFAKIAAQESVGYGLRHPLAELPSATLGQIEDELCKIAADLAAGRLPEVLERSRRLRDDIFLTLERRWLPWQEQRLYGFGARVLAHLADTSSVLYGLHAEAADHLRLARSFVDASKASAPLGS